MSDLFISYSRNDKAFVKRLHDALERREFEAWVDWEGIPPTAEWLREVYGAIDASQAFVFVLSRASNSSEVCGKELKRALAQNKRLVPIVCEELTAESAPEALAKLNWIFLRDEDDFDSGIDTFVESLNTDLDRVKATPDCWSGPSNGILGSSTTASCCGAETWKRGKSGLWARLTRLPIPPLCSSASFVLAGGARRSSSAWCWAR